MTNESLISDLRNTTCPEHIITLLQQQGIHTYRQLFAVLRDANADEELRADGCFAFQFLRQTVDRRRAVPPLLVALQSNSARVREVAVRALGALQAKRAIDVLIERVVDEAEAIIVRFNAIQALCTIAGDRVISTLKQWVHDSTMDRRIRSVTLEWMSEYDGFFEDCIRFLSDESADMRFWAAFRQPISGDVNTARSALDHVAAFDHTLPRAWGWHVDREALHGLECLDYAAIVDTDEFRQTWLISSTAEYATYMDDFCQWRDGWFYDTLSEPPTTFAVDRDWLQDGIADKWPHTQFNVRPSEQQTYLLDWHLVIDNQHLIGGLHRDRYAVVLTGDNEPVCLFTTWYRSQVSSDIALYLYEWAGTAIELPPDITVDTLATDMKRLPK